MFGQALKNEASKETNMVVGDKGALIYASSGSIVIDANVELNQSSTQEDVSRLMKLIFEDANKTENFHTIVDTMLMTMNKRGTRIGDGAKDLFVFMFLELYHEYPKTTLEFVKHIPYLGCYKDYWRIIQFIWNKYQPEITNTQKFYDLYNPLVNTILTNYIYFFEKDLEAYNSWLEKYPTEEEQVLEELSLTLAAKWCVSNGNKMNKEVSWFIKTPRGLKVQSLRKMLIRTRYNTLIIEDNEPFNIPSQLDKEFRQDASKLNKMINTAEIKTCSKAWSELEIKKLTGGFRRKNRKALLNEKLKGPLEEWEEDTGNRYPDDDDRVQCRINMLESIENGENINVGGLAPYQLLNSFYRCSSKTEKKVVESQWDALVKSDIEKTMAYLDELNEKARELHEGEEEFEPEVFKGCIIMCDVSPSMTALAIESSKTTCMDLSISLGIMGSQMNPEPYKDMVLAFSSNPSLIDLSDCDLQEKINRINRSMGYTTNLMAAIKKVLDVAKENNVPDGDIPPILIISDEGFDQQIIIGSYGYDETNLDTLWNTTYDNIVALYKQYGYSKVSMIYFWNVNARYAKTSGFQAQSDRRGVSMLSGFNSNSFKEVLAGQVVLKTQEDTKDEEVKNTEDDFRAKMSQKCFDIFRIEMSNSEERLLANYRFEVDGFETLEEKENDTNENELGGSRTWTEMLFGK